MGKRKKGVADTDIVLKPEMIDDIAAVSGLTKKASAEALDAVFTVIKSKLAEGKIVHVSGFGVFSVREIKAKSTINPVTKTPMTVGATATIRFKPLKATKDVARKNIQPD